MSGAQKRRENAYLQILVKDRGLMGQGIFLGEAYLPLCEVEEENMDRPLQDLPQIQLPLTRPQDTGEPSATQPRLTRECQSRTLCSRSTPGSTTDRPGELIICHIR